MKHPLVSVVTASYNMGHYLNEAVDSVLAQDVADVEVIVVNDGSKDDATPAALARYANDPRVVIINQDNAGQTVAKNRGLAAARGEYIGFCDADNAWLPGKLARQLETFERQPDLGVVYGDIQLIDDHGQDLPTPSKKRHSGHITGPLLADNFVTFNTTLLPRRVVEEFEGFDERLSMGIDYDLWLRISTRYEFLHLPEMLVRYRIWGGQMSHRTGERLDNFFRLLEAFVARYPDSVTGNDIRRAYSYSWVTRGLWHAREGRKSEALSDYRRAAAKWPFDARLWKCWGRLVVGR